MIVWVAYNDYGDLVAEADNRNDLVHTLVTAGIDEDEVFIGTVTP